MNQAATIAVSVLLATAAAVGATFALRAPADADAAPAADLARVLDELRTDHKALRQQVDALARAPQPASAAPASFGAERSAAPAVSEEQIGAAVEAWLRKHGGGAALASGGAAAAPTFDVATELDLLRGTSYDENPELWKRLHAAGKGKDAIARFEELVKANPKDTKAQMDLANACLSYMRVDPSDYNLAIRADTAFDDVLALDDKHWEARFTKAVSYSFWPEFTGKPKQAIGHFERLVAQQESMPAQAHEANTYLMLGNLLEGSDAAKAIATIERGLRRHPDNAELARRLAEMRASAK